VLPHAPRSECCDSPVTSAAYNLVHLIDVKPKRFDAWVLYGQLVVEALQAGTKPADAVSRSATALDNAFFDRVVKPAHDENKKLPDQAQTILYALYCTLRCFSDEDFDGMAAYLGGET
jgi:hypothetical protein